MVFNPGDGSSAMTEPQLQVIRLISGDKYVSNHALIHLALH